jgi:glutaconate CoA-transferase subunit B
MLQAAARRLADGELVLVGVGMPNEAANLAKATHAPGLTLVYESGAVDARPARPPLSIGDPTLVAGALASLSVADAFSYLIEGGRIDTAFVGAAEIDRRGWLNTTCIGDYAEPVVRLPGSGGACEIVDRARRVIVISPLTRRRFPERVGFVTSVPSPSAELVVVTDRAVLTRPPGGDELVLTSLFDGETVEGVQEEIGWPLQVAHA